MSRDELVAAFSKAIPRNLAEDLVDIFLTLRRDAATGTLERAAPGKLVETFVQILQHLETGKYEIQPSVDDYLKNLESRPTRLDDGLRICAARIARAMYTLRNKRNILHKGSVDPNTYDLRFLLHGAQWLLAELLRVTDKLSMEEAGRAVDLVQAPVGVLVEDFGGRHLVLAPGVSAREELLVLLDSHYPDEVSAQGILLSMNRRDPSTVRRALNKLWHEKLVEGTPKDGYRLTRSGLQAAATVIREAVATKTAKPRRR